MIIGDAYTAVDKVTLLAGTVGDVAVFDVETNAAPTAATLEITVATLCADSLGRTFIDESNPILLRDVTSYKSVGWATSQPKTVDVTIPATIVVAIGDIFELIITDYNDYNYIMSPRRIYYEATAADLLGTPEDNIAAGLAAQIAADISMPNVTAVAAANVITVTGSAVVGAGGANVINNFRADYEVLFNVNSGQGLVGVATIAVTQAPDKGCGMFREVRKLEEIHKGYKGHINRVIYPTSVDIQYKSRDLTLDAVPANGYDLLAIEFKSPQYTETEGDVHFQQSLTIAVPEGVGAAVDAVIAPLL
jgi:hypothetical protein